MTDRIPILRDATRLRVVHRQRVLRQGDAEPAPAFDRASLAPDVVAAAAGGWLRLVETEYESVVIAGWMASALARLGAPLDVLGAFGRVVEDEIRHVDLCAQMVELLGGTPSVPRGPTPPFPISVDGAAAEEVEFELLAGLVGFFCVFELLSADVFRAALAAAEIDLATWAIGEIHRDEAFHGAFGFETAKLFVPRWSAPLRRRLGARVAAEVARFERALARPMVPGGEVPPALARGLAQLGLLQPAALLAIVRPVIAHELVPRLEDLGVPIDLPR
jgi:hypothetical protein